MFKSVLVSSILTQSPGLIVIYECLTGPQEPQEHEYPIPMPRNPNLNLKDPK